MTRTHLAALLVVATAIPTAIAAASFFTSSASSKAPCFFAGATGYRISNADADLTVRIDNASAAPDLRLQLIDDAAAADFVLVDDGDAGSACAGATAMRNIRLAPGEDHADLTVALSRAPAPHKIYVHSAAFSQQDAAAVFAAIWRQGRKTAGSSQELAARD
jgi:hypothetical protein